MVGFLISESRGIHMGNLGIGKWLSWHPSTGIKGVALCHALFLWVCANSHRQEEDIGLPGAVLDTRKKLKEVAGPWVVISGESGHVTCSLSSKREHILEVVRSAALWRPGRQNLQARKAVLSSWLSDEGTVCRIALGCVGLVVECWTE